MNAATEATGAIARNAAELVPRADGAEREAAIFAAALDTVPGRHPGDQFIDCSSSGAIVRYALHSSRQEL